ncbi:hypothetical protein FOG51_02097 [Hanseniaspora uvarum]|nr:hypothetical protein FOG51_02097 [Hanseniaspora uvarum]
MSNNLENQTFDSSAKASKEETFSHSGNEENHPLGLSRTITSEKELEAEAAEAADLLKKPISQRIGIILICFCLAFGGFVFGFDTGTIGGFINMTDFKRRFGQTRRVAGSNEVEHYFTDVRTGLIVSLFNVGCAFGCLVLAKSMDLYGRKLAIAGAAVIYIVGILIQICSFSKFYQLFIGRLITGSAVGILSVVCVAFIGELSPPDIRSLTVALYQLMVTFGIFLGYLINFGTNKNYSDSAQWRIPLGLCFLWALMLIGALFFVPESSRYFVEKNRIEEARNSLAVCNKMSKDDPAIQKELDVIIASVENERLAGNASFRELFQTKNKVFQRLVMGVVIMSLQQLSGDNYFFYYGTTVFQAVLKNFNGFQCSIIIGMVNFVSTLPALYIVSRFGRRNCLLAGSLGMIGCLVVYSSVGVKRLWPDGYSDNDPVTSKGAGNCMIVFTCFYIFCFATTWASLAYTLCSETYPLRVKAKCMGIATAANWIWGFLISFFTPFITSAIRFAYGYVFMGCLIFSFFFVFFYVPETKDLSLEEVNELWLDGVLAWKSTSYVPKDKRKADYDATLATTDDRKGLKRFF